MQENDPGAEAGPVSKRGSIKAKHSLSVRVFLLIVILVTISGILIHIPSIADYCKSYLEHRILDSYIATRVLKSDTDRRLDSHLERNLLRQAKVIGIELRYVQANSTLGIGWVQPADRVFDLRTQSPYALLWESLLVLFSKRDQVLQVIDYAPGETELLMSVFLNEETLSQELYSYSRQAIGLSILISLVTAVFAYLSLQWLMVRSIHRITDNLIRFRQAPEAPESVIHPSGREDEIGLMEQELARMQSDLRAALAQQSRLAALGKAVSRINHDLKSILSTVSIASERLARMNDPVVSKIATLLVGSVEKATYLCTQTLDLARGDQPVLQRSRFRLADLVEEIGEALRLGSESGIQWQNEVDKSLEIEADRERLYRVLFNLGRNAVEALSGKKGVIRISATAHENGISIQVADNGPGIPPDSRNNLFQPFMGSARSGGIGLGLATARDLVRAHGGDLKLVRTDSNGTTFRIDLYKTH